MSQHAKPEMTEARRETMRRCRKSWTARHPEFSKLYQRTEKALAWKREWKKRNPDYPKKKWQRVREQVFAMYGSACARCGYPDKRALQLDHVLNDGHKCRVRRRDGKRVTKTQMAWYDAMRNFQPEKYQILCANCNWIKRHECENKA